ncbi:hypothetical protein DTO207G8_7574 [Paecilomyces variotii]|nr:hypothetical protein DTO207G8_7574 [Paecilomyces variotii]KAJ9250305.1 hypothetical protein DTO195F2_8180 [Paecilomyces variotii]KAJ9284114.1 hypothetical protein DTO021C3_8303 [Paecilomyces variotii]KAJ9351629.1 hypothetical protein DTO027B9_6216 [Paecilomyces variotii]KAJ9369763.1 hypothetical protein DTO282E5_5585 [Paecilomyces variotii]
MSTQDITNLSSPEIHRVISLPASQSLRASAVSAPGPLPTGLERLDEALSLSAPGISPSTQSQRSKGIPRGHVTEVFGPPGVGKTSLAMRTTANALLAEEKVVWIDTGSPIPTPRLRGMLQKAIISSAEDTRPSSEPGIIVDSLMENLTYFRAQSLPHLLALLVHPPKEFPPEGTALLVIDTISGSFPSYFPNVTELKSRLSQGRVADNQQLQWLLNRKWNVTSDLANHLNKLATINRMAVLVLNQTHTKIKGQPRPTLYPALAGGSWETAIYSRIVMYRDWPDPEAYEDVDDFSARRVRFAEITKRSGKVRNLRNDDDIVPFFIEDDGFRELVKRPTLPPSSAVVSSSVGPTPAKLRKRKVDEIADSEDDDLESDGDYGWIESDDAGLLADEDENAIEDFTADPHR